MKEEDNIDFEAPELLKACSQFTGYQQSFKSNEYLQMNEPTY